MRPKTKSNNFWKKVFVTTLVILGVLSFTKEKLVNPPSTSILFPETSQVLASESNQLNNLSSTTLPTVSNVSSVSAELQNNAAILASSSATLSSALASSQGFHLNIPILMYHYIRTGIDPADTLSYSLSVTPQALDQQFQYLHDNGFQTLSLNDLADSLENQTPLPPKSVILTFDDGYRDFYTDAFPLLKKYNFRAVSFYIAGYFNYPGYMNVDMLKEVHNSGLVDVESHTISHFQLTTMSLADAQKEIFESKRILEQVLNKKVNFFAYPYGDFNDQIVNLVKAAGYKLAFSTRPGNLLAPEDRYYLRRVAISGFDSLDTFKAKVGG